MASRFCFPDVLARREHSHHGFLRYLCNLRLLALVKLTNVALDANDITHKEALYHIAVASGARFSWRRRAWRLRAHS